MTNFEKPSDTPINPVRYIINGWFEGNRSAMARQMGWPITTLQDCEKRGSFTAEQQRQILTASDKYNWKISPTHFFPERLAPKNQEA